MRKPLLLRIPGRDFSGMVVSKGEHEGKEVWGTGPGLGMTRDGARAELISIPVQFVAPKPDTLSFEQAAAIGVLFTTAWAAVIEAAQLKAGETILIIGAGGAVGSAAVQIENWKQARVLGADRGTLPVPSVQAFINTAKEDLRHRVLELTGEKGVDVVFDVVGGPMFEPALRSWDSAGVKLPLPVPANHELASTLWSSITIGRISLASIATSLRRVNSREMNHGWARSLQDSKQAPYKLLPLKASRLIARLRAMKKLRPRQELLNKY